MNADRPEMSASGRVAAVWEDRWVRFWMALKKHGVERKHQDYYRSWVLSWIKFIKPRKFEEGNLEDVEGFLSQLGAAGKKGWQVHQAEEALQIMFQDVEPRAWARHWPEGLVKLAPRDLDSGEAANLGRKPIGDAGRFKGSTPMRRRNGAGSGCFRRWSCPRILGRKRFVASLVGERHSAIHQPKCLACWAD